MPKTKARSKSDGLPIIHPFAAGIDIGSRFHVAAVSPELCDEPVQTFQAFTDLERMADWLVATRTRTVVMESTGVYWVAAYEVLESRGLEVVLANAREARAVPGRKSDVNDAQWLQRLHACGLLRASFRPGRDIAELRAYLRARATYRLRRRPYPTHAEGADIHEHPAASRDRHHYRCYGDADYSRHRRRRARSGQAGRHARRPLQGKHRDDPRRACGQLPARARVRPEAVARALRFLPAMYR